jgi:hypothetical protein
MKRVWNELMRAGLALLPLIEYEVALHFEIFPVLWPPLGPLDKFGSVTSAVLATVAWVLPSMFTTRAAEKTATWVFVPLSTISLFVYVVMFLACVRSVETPDNGTQYRSVGFFRSEPFRTAYAGKGIRTAWTSRSITLARSGLFFSYFLTLASCLTAIGIRVKRLAKPYTAALPR